MAWKPEFSDFHPLLTIAPGIVQRTDHFPFDDPADTMASSMGIVLGGGSFIVGGVFGQELSMPPLPGEFSLGRNVLCDAVSRHGDSLQRPFNERREGQCAPCSETWSP